MSRMLYKLVALVAAGPVLSLSETLEELTVVTASKSEETRQAAVEKIVVVDRKTIEASGARNAEDVLAQVPGVVITHHPMAKVSIQGFDGDYVKVMVDGVEVAGDVGGAYPVNLIPSSDIEQIEIQKGAASALYGSDAMGGVINIITRKNAQQGFKGSVNQSYYSNDRYTGDAMAAYGWKKLSLSVSGNYDYDDGKASPWATPFDDTVSVYPVPENKSMGGKARLQWKDEKTLWAVSGGLQGNRRKSSGSSGMQTDFEDDGWSAGVELGRSLGQSQRMNWRADFKEFEHSTQQTNLAYGNKLPKTTATFRDGESEGQWNWEANSWNSVLVGLNATLNTMEGDDFTETKKTSNIDVFVQDIVHVGGEDRWQVVPGMRISNQLPLGEEPTDVTPTPKLSLRYAPDEQTIVRLAYGMGYKRPSLKQKYWLFFHAAPANFMLLGNPDLEPEKSHGINGSLEWKPISGLTLAASAYGNYIYNLITTKIIDENPGTANDLNGNERQYVNVRTYVNEDEAYTTGGEVSAEFRKNGYEAGASYSYLKARTKLEGEFVDLEGKNRHGARARFGKDFAAGTRLYTQVNWNGPTLYSRADDTYTPDYVAWDASVRQKIGKYVSVQAGVNNILDNWSFQNGNYADEFTDQENYYGLYDGRVYYATLSLAY